MHAQLLGVLESLPVEDPLDRQLKQIPLQVPKLCLPLRFKGLPDRVPLKIELPSLRINIRNDLVA